MNLKERGITVGDLLLFLIIAISTVLIIKKANESNNQAFFHIAPKEILITNKY